MGVSSKPPLKRSGLCVFCGNHRRYTQEHVIPQWVRDVLKTGPVTITDRDTGERLAYDETLTLVVNAAVCGPCNHGPLNRLGASVRTDVTDMILGNPVVLTPARARRLAAWITERALLLGLARYETRDDVAIRWVGDRPAASFRWLNEHSADSVPPPGTQVWIAYLDAMTNLPAWSLIGTWPESLKEPDGYLCAVSIGCFLFIAFGQDFRESDHHAPDGRSLGHLELPPRFGGYVVPIWPDPDELVVWPPAFGLSTADLPEIARLLTTAVVRRETYPARMIRMP
jgi:hypothetical protein